MVSIISTDESLKGPRASSASPYESEVNISMISINENDAEVSLWIDEKEHQHEKRDALNHTVAQLTDGRYSPIASTLNTSWDDVSVTQQKYYQRKVKEVFQAALSVVVPGQEQQLWNCVREETELGNVSGEPSAKRKRMDTGLVDTLISAHNDAENWQTKRQILSLFVNDFSKTELQQMIQGLSKWRIDQARRHAIDVGEGQPLSDKPIFRTRLDPVKTDHFIDYISRPCFLQDVAYGTRKLKLDSGGHAVIPAVIRTLIPSRIIAQYQAYCEEIGFHLASERTLFRILEVCSASMQKSLHGMDYIITENVQAFESLDDIASTLRTTQGVSSNWEKETKQQLLDAKRYLKADFRLHVSRDERCADHCTVYALSSTTDLSINGMCSHVHDIRCDACRGIETVIKAIGTKLDGASSPNDDIVTSQKLQFEHSKAKEAIDAWKAHNLRAVNQDLAKQDVLRKLNGNDCLIVMDWAMKFLPLRYREQMRDFSGKRGKSWHVSCVIEKQEEAFSVQCFVHLFELCKQDWFAVASIIESLLEILKREQPFISEVYLRSDNGACYHNAPLLFALPAIGLRTGIHIPRYDFSETQAGKDICDRTIAPMKAHIRRYVNEKHDVLTAADMKEALESHGGIRGCRAAVAAVNLANETGGTNKLKGISKLNNFEFTEAGIRVWCAYQVGPGRLVSYEGMILQGKTGMTLLQQFGPIPQTRSVVAKPHCEPRASKNQVFYCDTPGCVLTFGSENDAQAHMDTGEHTLVLERESAYDSVRRKWAQHVTEVVSRTVEPSTSTLLPGVYPSSCDDDAVPLQGWALKGQKTATKTSENVKAFLIAKFNEGLRSGQKANPADVSKEMQEARDSKGLPRFSSEEWKTTRQISSFFSRQKSSDKVAVAVDDDEILDDDDFRSLEDHCVAKNLREEVYDTVDIQHPLSFEGRNICLMAKDKKLKKLKVSELKDICAKFVLPTEGNQQRKITFIDAIEDLVNCCSCSSV